MLLEKICMDNKDIEDIQNESKDASTKFSSNISYDSKIINSNEKDISYYTDNTKEDESYEEGLKNCILSELLEELDKSDTFEFSDNKYIDNYDYTNDCSNFSDISNYYNQFYYMINNAVNQINNEYYLIKRSNPRRYKKYKNTFKQKEGDWLCSRCKNINFKFRYVCHRCNLDKKISNDMTHKINDSNNKNLK